MSLWHSQFLSTNSPAKKSFEIDCLPFSCCPKRTPNGNAFVLHPKRNGPCLFQLQSLNGFENKLKSWVPILRFFPVLNAAWRWFLKIVLVGDEIIGKILGTMAKPQFLLVCNPSNKLINTAIEQKQNWPRYCSQFFQQSSF